MNTHRHTLLTGTFLSLSMVYCAMLLSWAGVASFPLSGLVLRTAPSTTQPGWKTFETREVASGVTIPAATNVIFHLPASMASIRRLVLFGPDSKTIRYWGYCFPLDGVIRQQSGALPGKVFLSEAERAWRRAREEAQKPIFSIYNIPTREQLNQQKTISTIRHQLEVFPAGSTCYVMSEKPLSIGTDADNDGVNIKIEREKGTDPFNPDTDGDGVLDGLELWSLKTDPVRRDTDGDALIDGVEDANLNGVVDPGETDPRSPDSDKDSLCDGDCRVYQEQKLCKDNAFLDCIVLPYGHWAGEDRNLSGTVDQGERDPRKADTDGDGIRDDQEYYNCLLTQQQGC